MSSLAGLLSQLQVHAQNEDHEIIFQQWFGQLKQFPSDSTLLRQVLVSLIKMDKYDKAFKILDKYKVAVEKNEEATVVERAYIFYKLGKSDLLHSITSSNRAFKHILAQDYYKNGDNLKALETYKELILTNNDLDNQLDLSCNERAVISQLHLTSSGLDALNYEPISRVFEESYDQLFNNSLIQISLGNYPQALDLLIKAEATCQEANKEISEDDLFSEIAPIRIQTAYVEQITGNSTRAKEILDSFNLTSITDSMIKLITYNNYLSLTDLTAKNANVVVKDLEYSTLLNNLKSKLTVPQWESISRNNLLLSFISGKDIAKASKKYSQTFPHSLLGSGLSSLTKAGVELGETEKSRATRTFHLANKDPENISTALIAVYSNIESGNYDNSASILENLIKANPNEALNKPAVIGVLLAIYDKLNKEEATTKLLNEIFDFYKSRTITDNDEFEYLKTIAFKLLPIDSSKSMEIFKTLSSVKQDELISKVLSNSTDNLVPVSQLTSGLSVDALIESGVQPLIRTRSKVSSFKIKKPRDRKTRLPKPILEKIAAGDAEAATRGFEKLDKERWLQMKDRSYFKPKKGKKSKDTQGGSADNSTEMNLVSSVPSSSGSTASKKPATKKTKKKGKR